MKLLHRYGGLKQRVIAERMGGLDEGLVSPGSQSDPGKMDGDPQIRKRFQDLHSGLST
jgi:hypothetical protein